MFSWFRSASPKKLKNSTSQVPEVSHAAPQVRVVFMGTPKLSALLLQSLIENDYNLVGVVTQPDKTAGRKHELVENEVKKMALENNIPLLQPHKLDESVVEAIKNWNPDLILVAAYGKILPKTILDIPGFGCVNFHTSLLPAWRGASPIQNALLAGATETGVTLMLMDEGMDTGDIIAQVKVSILPEDSRVTLTEKLTVAGKGLLLSTLPLWIDRKITPIKQNNAEATLCQLIEREDGHIMWTDSAESIYNRFRALTPWPGIFSFLKKDDNLVRIKLTRVSYQKQDPQIRHALGEIFELGDKIGVQAGSGVILLEEVQMEGKNPLPIQDFIRGNAIIGNYLQ